MVTITSYGRLSLNKNATSRLERAGAKYVGLLWDADSDSVGIAPEGKSKDSFTLAFGTNGNGAAFSCIQFLMFIKYDWSTTRNFGVEWSEASGMYVFTIPKEFLGKTISGDHLKRAGVNKQIANEKEVTEVTS